MSEPATIRLRDGEVVLYRRRSSSKWQARVKVQRRWHRLSTGQTDPQKAGDKACRRQDEMNLRIEVGRPPVARTFKSVAEVTIRDMEMQLQAGEGRVVFAHYIGALRGYFIPFFGTRAIETITWRDLLEFNAWRVKKLGRVPKASTLNNHNAALRKVFNTAVAEGWISEARVPPISAKGAKGMRRPTFSEEEVDAMDDLFSEWINLSTGEGGTHPSRNRKTPLIRSLLHDYAMFVAETGVRPGTEMRNMRWRDIQKSTQRGVEYWLVTVRGKTGEREIVLDHFAAVALEGRMGLLSTPPAPSDRIWVLPTGEDARDLHGAFEQFLTWAELLEAPSSGRRRTLYSLRHYYATKRILAGSVDLHTLARQMGTSVAMLEKHYSHLKPRQKAKELAGTPLPKQLAGKFLVSEWLRTQRRGKRTGSAA